MDAAVTRYQAAARRRRGELFMSRLAPTRADRILDLGGGDGGHIASIVGPGYGVTVADIDERALSRAAERGFETVLLAETGALPFEQDAFDIVFCSSVIEHATGAKPDILACRNGRQFRREAWQHQTRLADEIRRVSRRYFVQTPNRWFPIEAHTWLPGVQFLPRRALMGFLPLLDRSPWPWKMRPDIALLSARDMQNLFPDAVIVRERSAALTLGLTKSLIAVKHAQR
jgi:hypothetical protein